MWLFIILTTYMIVFIQSKSLIIDSSPLMHKPHQVVTNTPDYYNMTVPQIIIQNGYPAETHIVVTKDGYILKLHRIPHGIKNTNSSLGSKTSKSKGENVTRHPILLQHGLLASSSCWIMNTPDKAPAYVFADAGYDVWLGNARGNIYSRAHQHLKPEDKVFWDFSFDEMGEFDVPAMIDYILNKTNNKKLTYIGHSMGTTMFWAAMNYHPEYNKKISAMFAMGPVAYISHARSPIKYLAHMEKLIVWIAKHFDQYEFLPRDCLFMTLVDYLCTKYHFEEVMCENNLFLITGFDAKNFNLTWMPMIIHHLDSGTSINTVNHYGQEYLAGKFQYYDYGVLKNLRIYKQLTPPLYDLKKVTAPVVLLWGENDWLADPKDVSSLAKKLPNLVKNYKVPDPQFNHLDFLWGINSKEVLLNYVLKLIPFFV